MNVFSREFLQKSVAIVLFLAVPIFFALFGSRIMFGDAENKWREVAEERLGEILGEAESDKDPMKYYSRFFRRVEKLAFSEKEPLESWKKVTRFLKRKFPGQIEVVFLDAQGKPVAELTDRPVSKFMTQKLFSAYHVFLREKKALPETVQAFMKNFLGHLIPVDHDASKVLNYASGAPKEWFLYFSNPHPEGMYFLFFKPIAPLEEMALKEKMHRLERANPDLKLCLAIRGEKEKGLSYKTTAGPMALRLNREPKNHLYEKLGLLDVGGKGLWEVLQESRSGQIWIDDILIGRRVLSPRCWVIASLSPIGRNRFFQNLSSIPMMQAFALLAILILGMARVFPVEFFLSSVRIKLLGLFLYSALVPLIVMGVTAQKFLAERQLVLEYETHLGVEKSIQAFDGCFLEFVEELRETLANHHYSGDLSSPDALLDLKNRFPYYQKKYGFDICRVFDSAGKIQLDFYQPDAPTYFGGLLKMLTKISQKAFDSFSPKGIKEAQEKMAKSDPQIPAGNLLDMVLPNVSATTLVEVRLGNLEAFFGILPLGDAQNQMSHYGMLVWFRQKMESGYVRKQLFSFARNCDQGLFYAWNPDSAENIFPAISSRTAFIRPFLPLVTSGSSGFRRIVEWEGRPCLLTGMRGNSLRQFSFLCLTSYQKVQSEINRLRWHGGFISLAIVGMCFLITFLLSRFIMDPLGNLTKGIAAISRRDFRYQIPLLARDELGNLAEVFNQTLEDLKDLEVARTIQESLFPRAPLVIGSWEIYGTCHPASQVGGDYFDYLPLGQDRALIIIADVSGHGVGAALVVAMAKAVVTQIAAAMGKPEDLLAALNKLLWAVLKRKKMMSCCIGIFHGDSGNIDLVNAGHCSPLLLAGENTGFVKMTSYPLGCSKNWKPALGALTIEKHQAVLLYSDGLVEALDRQGEPIGYDRFAAATSGLIRGNAVDTEAAIRSWHAEISPRRPPEDDASLIIVQEKKSDASLP